MHLLCTSVYTSWLSFASYSWGKSSSSQPHSQRHVITDGSPAVQSSLFNPKAHACFTLQMNCSKSPVLQNKEKVHFLLYRVPLSPEKQMGVWRSSFKLIGTCSRAGRTRVLCFEQSWHLGPGRGGVGPGAPVLGRFWTPRHGRGRLARGSGRGPNSRNRQAPGLRGVWIICETVVYRQMAHGRGWGAAPDREEPSFRSALLGRSMVAPVAPWGKPSD